MKYKLRLRGAEDNFGYAWFLIPFGVSTGDVFMYEGKLSEVKGVIHNPVESNLHDGKNPVELDIYLL